MLLEQVEYSDLTVHFEIILIRIFKREPNRVIKINMDRLPKIDFNFQEDVLGSDISQLTSSDGSEWTPSV